MDSEVTKIASCVKLFGKTKREIQLQEVGEGPGMNSDWNIKWQMAFSAIKCKVLQMEENSSDFKYTVRRSQLFVSAHSQLHISAQQRN